MIIKCDQKGLEWRAKVWLSQDPIAMEELEDPSRDIHVENQAAFNLPRGEVGRVVAKGFLYRMIFADAFGDQGFLGPGHAFSKDNNFSHVSTSPKYWAGIVERFFDKYQGVYNHSIGLIRQACETGVIVSPSGREYEYAPLKKWNGEMDWPRTQILNHQIQGFSADLMVLFRRIIYKQWPYYGDPKNALLINTVHDDVEADVINDPDYVFAACEGMENASRYLPGMAKKWYGVDLNVPFEGEVKFGGNLAEELLSKFNKETFLEDYNACLKKS